MSASQGAGCVAADLLQASKPAPQVEAVQDGAVHAQAGHLS